MAKLTIRSKDQTLPSKMTIKQNAHYTQREEARTETAKYKKFLIASICLNIVLTLTTIGIILCQK
jgi:hypothetical protein